METIWKCLIVTHQNECCHSANGNLNCCLFSMWQEWKCPLRSFGKRNERNHHMKWTRKSIMLTYAFCLLLSAHVLNSFGLENCQQQRKKKRRENENEYKMKNIEAILIDFLLFSLAYFFVNFDERGRQAGEEKKNVEEKHCSLCHSLVHFYLFKIFFSFGRWSSVRAFIHHPWSFFVHILYLLFFFRSCV